MKINNVLLKGKQKKNPRTLYLLTNKVITCHPAIQNLKGTVVVNLCILFHLAYLQGLPVSPIRGAHTSNR